MSLLSTSVPPQTFWDFDPTTIPDCDIWFDAADTSTITAVGTTVKSWANKGYLSLAANAHTGTVTTGNTENGRNYLNFGVASEMRFMCALTAQSRSWFVVMRNNTQLVTGSTFTGPINQTVGAGQDSVVYSRIGNTTYGIGCGPSGVTGGTFSNVAPNPFGTIHVTTIINSATSTSLNEVRINGTSYTVSTNFLAASYNTSNVVYRIHTNVAGQYVSSDDIFEIIHYNRDLSLTERRMVESYLMWKWGVVRGNEYNFTPTNISGCLAWYHSDVDFNDVASRANCFTFNAGNSIDTWLDLSGNNRTATFVTASPSTTRPVLTANQLNGKCSLVFAGASALTNTLSLSSTQPLTLFAVTAPNQSGFRSVVSINSRPITRGQSLTIYQTNGNLWWFSGGTAGTDGTTGSIATATNRYDILAFYWNPTLRTQMNINGNYIQPSSSSPATLRTTDSPVMIIGATCVNATSTFNELWSGGICEIILYNSVLSTTDRNRVEKYLSLKWNRPLINAGFLGHPNRFIAPKNRRFNPTDVNNCVLWLDGADKSTMTFSGSNVTAITDKSTNVYNIVPVGSDIITSVDNGLNGNHYLNLGSNRLTISNFNWRTRFTLFMVIRSNAGSFFYNQFDGTNFQYVFTGNFYLMNINSVLFLRDSVNANGVPVIPNNTWVIFTIGYPASGTVGSPYRINGTVRTTSVQSGTAVSDLTVTKNLFFNGTSAVATDSSQIAEIIHYDESLTSGDIQKIEGYLADKWGLRSSLSATHPVYYGPAYTDYISFNPTTVGTIALWLDASDISTINGGSITDGGIVSTVTNKAGSSTVAISQATGTSYLRWRYVMGGAMNLANGGLPAFDPTPGAILTGNLLPRSTAFTNTTFIVMCSTGTTNASSPGCVHFYNNSSNASTLTPCTNAGSGTTLRARAFNGTTTTDTTAVSPVSFTNRATLISSTYDSVSGVLNIYRDSTGATGTVTVTSKPIYGSSTNTVYSVGGSTGNPWTGYISEVIVYTTVLSDADRNKVETYLAKKWQIGHTSGAAVSNIINVYQSPLTIPNEPQIFPTTFADISVWLDATDPDGDGLQPSSGTVIRTWTDRSGNSRHAVQTTAANCPTFNYDGAYPGILFNRSLNHWLLGTSALTSTNYGVFVVARSITSDLVSGVADTVFFARKVTTAGAENYIRMTAWGRTGLSIFRHMLVFYSNAATPTTKQWIESNPSSSDTTSINIYEISDNSVTTNSNIFYLNGSLLSGTATGSTANVATDAEGYRLGVTNIGGGLSNYLFGYIYEVIIILHQPTVQERQFIEGYLAWKWGIQSKLPASHPYRRVKT